jgi:hypothetical protein
MTADELWLRNDRTKTVEAQLKHGNMAGEHHASADEEDRFMKRLLFSVLLLGAGTAFCGAAEFEAPVRLKAGGVPIRVEAPGYAAPSLADVDGDGKMDVLVGQFNLGKIQVFKGLGEGKFARGKWLQAEGKDAEVPGVW